MTLTTTPRHHLGIYSCRPGCAEASVWERFSWLRGRLSSSCRGLLCTSTCNLQLYNQHSHCPTCRQNLHLRIWTSESPLQSLASSAAVVQCHHQNPTAISWGVMVQNVCVLMLFPMPTTLSYTINLLLKKGILYLYISSLLPVPTLMSKTLNIF